MKKSMIKITSGYGNEPTFKLIPMHKDCPFLEAFFNPQIKLLNVVSLVQYEGFQMVYKLDDNGNKILLPVNKQQKNQPLEFKKERKTITHFYEYIIAERNEIETFVELMTENVKAADIGVYFEVKQSPNPAQVPDGVKLTVDKKDSGAETN